MYNKGMKVIRIKEDHFNAPLSWLTECTEQEYFDFVSQYVEGLEYDLGGDGHCIVENGYSIIWVDDSLDAQKYIETLSHELIHYCTKNLHDNGVPVSWENDESLAYYHTKMFRKCIKKSGLQITK